VDISATALGRNLGGNKEFLNKINIYFRPNTSSSWFPVTLRLTIFSSYSCSPDFFKVS